MSLESQPQIILATESSQLLDSFSKVNIDFTPNNSIFTPSKQDSRFDPMQFAKDMSLEKANQVNSNKQNLIISTYRVLSLEGKLLLKPKNRSESHQQLKDISGKTINYITGVTIIDNKKSRRINQLHTFDVTIANLSKQEQDWYTITKEFLTKPPIDIYNLGLRFVKKTEGTETPIRLIIEQLINLGYEDFLMPKPKNMNTPAKNTGSHLPFL
jgi:septum formation protein